MLFRKKQSTSKPITWNINHSILDLILECAKSSYPNEFASFLKVDKETPHTIQELVLLPGTISGDAHAIFKLHMLPIDYSIIGTVHSHPSSNASPSPADQALFERYGKIHIISAYPYTPTSWQAYDYQSKPLPLKVI